MVEYSFIKLVSLLFSNCNNHSIFLADTCITIAGPSNGTTCVFPFIFSHVTYEACTMETEDEPWCSTKVDDNNVHIGGEGNWGYCDLECPCNGPECPLKESDEGRY